MFLYQPSSGYRYNSDSIFLYDFIRQHAPRHASWGRLLDVGCGVGILSLLLSRDTGTTVAIIDKQPSMLEYAKRNFSINHLEAELFLGDFADFVSDEKFDIIVSNPPFYDSAVQQSECEHTNIARYSHHLPIDRLVANVKKQLTPRGRFLFCYDAKQTDRVLCSLRANKLNPERVRFVHSKADREAKIVMILARLASKSMLRVMPPLIVFSAEGHYTTEAQQAFDRAGTYSIKGDY